MYNDRPATATKATHTHFTSDKGHTHTNTPTLEGRRSRADRPTGWASSHVGCSLSGAARGQRALLEADDAVGDVRGVRVDRRPADRREVVREVAPRVELAVLGAVAAALLVGGAPGEVTEEAGPAGGYAPEALYQEQLDLVVLVAQRVVVVALVS